MHSWCCVIGMSYEWGVRNEEWVTESTNCVIEKENEELNLQVRFVGEYGTKCRQNRTVGVERGT